MKYKCKCESSHDFKMFETFPTVWGGRTSLYEYCCQKIDKHMVLVTSTYPPSVYSSLCPDARHRRYIMLFTLLDWDEFMKTEWIHAGEIKRCAS